ncbi:MAG TPA: PDZ domain-containing protein [Candidatus Methylomirabilis sp.]|nr:PDZ domain-containing protein [Candidatus Methylomirabilis sp.]
MMLKRNLFMAGGVAALGVALIAVPGHTAPAQDSTDARIAKLEQRLEALQARLAGAQDHMAARLAEAQDRMAERLQERAAVASDMALLRAERAQERLQRVAPLAESDDDGVVLLGDEGTSWLGVESQDVNSEKAKDLKLPAERGVLLDRIVPDSPAAKAGLKENDVITEVNGQRVEGELQFRRMIHEIPAGRSTQFTVWRDGRAQTISVTLGKSEERADTWVRSAPRAFSFELPRVEIPDIQIGPGAEWNYGVLAGGGPRLGIDAEDLSGQLGTYFGAPDGEGVLVREVNPGSPAEKAGVKSGDVITSVDGERVRSVGDLREQLADKRDAKSVKLGVLRNKAQMSLSVELPERPSKARHTLSRRTQI